MFYTRLQNTDTKIICTVLTASFCSWGCYRNFRFENRWLTKYVFNSSSQRCIKKSSYLCCISEWVCKGRSLIGTWYSNVLQAIVWLRAYFENEIFLNLQLIIWMNSYLSLINISILLSKDLLGCNLQNGFK